MKWIVAGFVTVSVYMERSRIARVIRKLGEKNERKNKIK